MVLLAKHKPGFSVEATYVDGRFTDVLMLSVERLERLGQAPGDRGRDSTILRWLKTGRIVFDRDGHLAAALAKGISADGSSEIATTVWSVNYDLIVSSRYAESDDAVYTLALAMRSLHVFFRIVMAWFTCRGLLWEGEKKAIQHLAIQDPDFLALVRAWLAEPNAAERHGLSVDAARVALEPAGGLWPAGQVDRRDGLWESLVATA